MSWEKSSEKTVSCPCGKGTITQEIYSDDWNRFSDKTPKIQCVECSEKYTINSEYHCPKPYHNYTVHYCIPKSYPSYCGAEYSAKANGAKQFSYYLAEQFTLAELESSLNLLNSYSSYSKFPPSEIGNTAKSLVLSAKSKIKTQKLTIIKPYLEEAIENYNSYPTNNKTLEQGKNEYDNYKKDYYAVAIRLNL